MPKRTSIATILLLVLLARPAAAAAPQIVDQYGDANVVGTLAPTGSTEPVSHGPADLLSVSLRTTYTTDRVGADGRRHHPTGVEVAIVTARPTSEAAIQLAYHLLFSAGSCRITLSTYVNGRAQVMFYPGKGAVEWRQDGTGCPDAPPSAVTKLRSVATGDGLVILLPFADLAAHQRAVLAPGTHLDGLLSLTTGHQSTGSPDRAWLPQIDLATGSGGFTVGEDVPRDVPCTRDCA